MSELLVHVTDEAATSRDESITYTMNMQIPATPCARTKVFKEHTKVFNVDYTTPQGSRDRPVAARPAYKRSTEVQDSAPLM